MSDVRCYGRDGTLTLEELRFAAFQVQCNCEDPVGCFRAAFDPAGILDLDTVIDRCAELLLREDIALEIYIQQRMRDATDMLDLALSQMGRGEADKARFSMTMARCWLLGLVSSDDAPDPVEALTASPAVVEWLSAQSGRVVH
jgi:hypothetical protein